MSKVSQFCIDNTTNMHAIALKYSWPDLHSKRSVFGPLTLHIGRCVCAGNTSGDRSQTTTTTTTTGSLTDVETVSRLQDDAQLALNRYIDITYQAGPQPFRFGKLLLLLASLRSVSADAVEHLYFRSTLGSIPVSRIVADMFASADL